ncbi:MAG TPA: MgtC/SapB family protein [Ktedonobacteraceae bacterium]
MHTLANANWNNDMYSFLTILLRLGLAVFLGSLIGLERESREHAAGMRTNALVSLGSCLFTIISAFGFLDFTSTPHVQIDPTRIASYIVAGIGFLGAGTIFLSQDKNKVRGLTTAATVWLVAAIGMACGAGLFAVAVVATALGLIVLIVLRLVEQLFLPRKSSTTQHLQIEASSMGGQLIGQVCDTLMHAGIRIKTLDLRIEQESEVLQIVCTIPDTATLAKVVDQLRALPGVRAVQANLQDIDKENAASNGE